MLPKDPERELEYREKLRRSAISRGIGGSERRVDILGQRFGSLSVIEFIEVDKGGNSKWKIKCDCGYEFKALLGNIRVQTQCKNCSRKSVVYTPEWKQAMSNGWVERRKRLGPPKSYKDSEWRMLVLERDNNICQGKGPHRGLLAVHHKKPKKEFPELEHEVANGLTLCRACHRREEHQLVKEKLDHVISLAVTLAKTYPCEDSKELLGLLRGSKWI